MLYINGEWKQGLGEVFSSLNPATFEQIWEGPCCSVEQIHATFKAAKQAFEQWKLTPFEKRVEYLEKCNQKLFESKEELELLLSQEIGKPLWESKIELASMQKKLGVSIESYQKFCKEKHFDEKKHHVQVRYKPHGIVAIISPFNQPGHLTLGHMIPALLAGNTVILKGSELVPAFITKLIECFEPLPSGVVNLLHGGAFVGKEIAKHPLLNGLFFTGSYLVGKELVSLLGSGFNKILVLEMGGNNPLVIDTEYDLDKASEWAAYSAFLTTGQRCISARRLILLGSRKQEFIEALVAKTQSLKIGPYTDDPEPFMGPVADQRAKYKILKTQKQWAEHGHRVLLNAEDQKACFISPSIIELDENIPFYDKEVLGPLLSVKQVSTIEQAISESNSSHYGLAAGLISNNEQWFEKYFFEVDAGIINWNAPLTEATSRGPFGGIKDSGNHRPTGFFASHYSSYPVISKSSLL